MNTIAQVASMIDGKKTYIGIVAGLAYYWGGVYMKTISPDEAIRWSWESVVMGSVRHALAKGG